MLQKRAAGRVTNRGLLEVNAGELLQNTLAVVHDENVTNITAELSQALT
jgi:hypothetical protein